MVGRVDLDENPRWWRRGHRRRQCSGGQRRQGTCAREPVRHGEGVGAVNREHTCRMRGNRRRQWRRWREQTPVSVGREM
jgi:hypothetical protein